MEGSEIKPKLEGISLQLNRFFAEYLPSEVLQSKGKAFWRLSFSPFLIKMIEIF